MNGAWYGATWLNPSEFRRKVLDLVEAGRPVAEVEYDLKISDQSICTRRRHDRIDHGLEPGLTSRQKAELTRAKQRVAELETELCAKRAIELTREVVSPTEIAVVEMMAVETSLLTSVTGTTSDQSTQGAGVPLISLDPSSGRYLSFAEREEIAMLTMEKRGVREIARRLGRNPSTTSRELHRNAATQSGRLDLAGPRLRSGMPTGRRIG